MTDLPEWVKSLQLEGKIQYKKRESGVICLKGSHPGVYEGRWDLTRVLQDGRPPGHSLAKVTGVVEHSRGHRFTWQVLWVTSVEAERRYQEKQAKRMSRFVNQREGM